MKIVLSWLLDYIECSFSDINIDILVHLFNTRVAEIESVQKIEHNTQDFFIVQVKSIESNKIIVYCAELLKDLDLSFRSDVFVGKYYLVVLKGSVFQWLKISDFSEEKEGLFPAVDHSSGNAWRSGIASVDYIFDVDNKSINHRPDLWGHYGIAREVAAFLNLPLKSLKSVLLTRPVVEVSHDLSVTLAADIGCSRIAALHCQNVTWQDSQIWMAIRLASVGAKPISGIVDITNYVMFDIGHPMHAFDSNSFVGKKLAVRSAKPGEMLELLDGQKITLTKQDMVVANEKEALSLAGIMGGKNSGCNGQTTSIVLEAAGFDPFVIRKTAQHFKLRTESSMRFEKHLDPMQNIVAIERFLFLAQQVGIVSDFSSPIVSAGKEFVPSSCVITHEFITKSAGVDISSEFIIQTLQALDFGVNYNKQEKNYTVTIPTLRMTKDISIKQDILEEIIRSYGFENITPILPARSITPFDVLEVENVSKIKKHLAFGLGMHEIRDYLLYDASFVQSLDIDLSSAISVRNPLSQNWITLVTSLIPHLIKGVVGNASSHDRVRLFENNSIWIKNGTDLVERKSVSGIMFDKKNIDFYKAKQELQSLWDLCEVEVVWKKPEKALAPWYDKHKSAQLFVGATCIGTAGIVSQQWMHKVVVGAAFIFELDGEFLQSLSSKNKRFIPWSKYQDVTYDLSLLIPVAVTVDQLIATIKSAHLLVCAVSLIDFFEKEEWKNQRSVTLRYMVRNFEKTMTKSELEEVVASVELAVKKYDVQIR